MQNKFMLLYNNIEDVYNACLQSIKRMPLSSIKSEDRDNKTVIISFSGGLFGKDDEITVTMEAMSETQTKVNFASSIVENNNVTPKPNKNIEKIKVALESLLPKPVLEETIEKREMPSPMGPSPFANQQEQVNEAPLPMQDINNEPTVPNEHFEDYPQVDIKPISNEPSDSSKVQKGYDPLGDFMNKL